MADGVDIDLYADVEQDFPQEDFSADNNDLYDDVITASSGDRDDKKLTPKKEPSVETSPGHASRPEGRRWQLYIGNLTWWTTDQDIADSIQNLGISDFIEVKFYENRANGQSKGFCCVCLGSESSMRKVMDQLPKKEMHGQNPVVTYATKQALHQFEAQSKTRPPQQSGQGNPPRGPPPGHPGGPPPGPHPNMRPPMRGPPPGVRGPPPGHPGGPPPGAPPFYRGPPPSHGHPRGPPPGVSHPPPGPPPVIRGPPPGIRPPIPGIPMSGPPPHSAPPIVMGGPPPSVRALPPGMPPQGPPPIPGAHVNPAFFPPGAPPTHLPYHDPGHGLSELEFEEIMSRNRTVSSSAIARAVQDAANGEFASAIETLVTAISLIKQSKVANDDRCKILISSLQDTLSGIENKSYAGGRARHSRSPGYRRSSHSRHSPERYRERSPGREYYRAERSRSRDRERDYRREKEYYDERYREREGRDPERERGEARERESRREPERAERERGEQRGSEREARTESSSRAPREAEPDTRSRGREAERAEPRREERSERSERDRERERR